MTTNDYNPYEYGENFRYDDLGDNYELKDVAKGCLRMVLTAAVILALLCAVLSLVGCKSTEYVEVPVIHTDTLIQTKVQRDSIWKHDSIFISQWQAGDTIFQVKDRWHTKYVESIKHDTVYVSKCDTITKTITKTKTDTLTWWQQTRMHLGGAVIWLALLAFVVWLGKKKLRL
jgi:hypothetical protein